jgi:soluble lytic murein transglycosylase-like protein
VVRVLPSWSIVVNERRNKQHTRGRKRNQDFRIICDCQRHAGRARGAWRRALRIASRGAAILVSIPLAFMAMDPTATMNIKVVGAVDDLRQAQTAKIAKAQTATVLPMFTTDRMREQFLSPDAQRSLTLDVFKEEYFKEHVPYGAIIFREARRNDLPPELVAAMVHTESDFRAGLVSNKSAQGLMQIVPSTARLLGIQNPFDPEQNIAAGTKYFRYLLNRFDNETIALAAYNAGEGNVERFGGVPPFAETKSYIAKVNRRTHRYRQRVHNTYIATLRVQGPEAQ